MKTFKKIVAWILVLFSVLGVVIVLTGLVGSWVVRNKVTDITVNLLTVGETAVTATSNGVNRIDDRLDVSQENIATLEDDIMMAGDELSETSVVGTAVRSNISEETAVSIREARATAVSIADTVHAIDEAIQSANEIPFVNLDGKVSTLVGDLSEGLVDLDETMTAFRTGVEERREERISNSVDFFTGLTGEMSSGIGDMQTRLNEIDGRLADTSTSLAAAKVSLPRLFTLITLMINVLLFFIGLAFASLLLHSWQLAKNPDLTWSQMVNLEK